jgi:chemotaxis protein CheZ
MFPVDQLKNVEGPSTASDPDADAIQRHHELILEIRALRSAIESRDRDTQRMMGGYHAQFGEIHKLKGDLDLIQAAIEDTKRAIATLHGTGFRGRETRHVTDQLDAVAGVTESATEHILGAAEHIDRRANTLSALVPNEPEQKLAADILERVVEIFEACNFQDITGQRITKVVATLKFIEDHIVNMMEIWGGIDALRNFTPAAMAQPRGGARLLNGPKLDAETGHASQDDIDALFN